MPPKPKKRNPPDATRRNIQAANKRIKALEEKVSRIEKAVLLFFDSVIEADKRGRK